jgi:DNA-binding MarR family transcriptional regulator
MAANVLLHHTENPYKTDKRETNLVLFTASERTAIHLVQLAPIHLRIIIALASKLNPSGYACIKLYELAHYIGNAQSYINQGLMDLVRLGYIAKKKRGEYWVNPSLFRPAAMDW